MKKKTLWTFFLMIMLFQSIPCQAESHYSVEYAPNSPIKNISLKNAEFKLKIYAYQKPQGFLMVKTNNNQQFTMEKSYDIAVEGIKGEEEYNARCSGHATIEDKKINITCRSR